MKCCFVTQIIANEGRCVNIFVIFIEGLERAVRGLSDQVGHLDYLRGD